MPALESAAPTPTDNALMLQQTRVIRASRARVYQAWTNPETLLKWFGPVGMQCPSATLDLRVGGEYRLDFPQREATPTDNQAGQGCDAQRTAAVGHYTKIVPDELLQFTWSPDWNLGEESLVTVSLKDVTGGTEITILHENFNTEASRDGHNKGWMGCLDKLANLLQK